MGGCLSKPREHVRWKGRKRNTTSAKGVIPLARSLPKNRSGSSKGQEWDVQDEIWFDAQTWFEKENSDDEYQSVDEDFQPPLRKASYAFLRKRMSRVAAWIAPPPYRDRSHRSLCGTGDVVETSPQRIRSNVEAPSISACIASDDLDIPPRSRALESSLGQHLPDSPSSPGLERTSLSRVRKWDKVLSIDIPCRKASTSETSPACSSGRSITPDGQSGSKSGKAGEDAAKSVFDSSCIPRLLNSVAFRISFKRRSGGEPHSMQMVERPVAGTQVPKCASNKMDDGCWSKVNPATFKLRSISYFKDKKKSCAPDYAIFEPLGVDVFLTSHKVDHIAQFVELPWQNLEGAPDNLPHILIVNAQVPSYPPAVFLGDTDGEGYSICMYFKLSDAFKKRTPLHLKEMLQKFVNDDTEKVRGLVGETTLSFRERLKLVARLQNLEDLQASATEKKLLLSYNEKPILSRPQHVFYKGPNYLEIDLDVHRFSYIARKGLDTIRERLKLSVLDIGLTIQAQKPEELPEQLLCCVRLNKLDFGNFKYLTTPEPLSLAAEGGCYPN